MIVLSLFRFFLVCLPTFTFSRSFFFLIQNQKGNKLAEILNFNTMVLKYI